jgi:hypothetical protein
MRRDHRGVLLSAVLVTLLLGGCGATGPASQQAEITITPTVARMAPSEVRTFQAAVTGATDKGVAWSASCGTVTASGLYTAPATARTCQIVATSQADQRTSATAAVDVVSGLAAWRPFSADSPWNTPIPGAPALAPDSATLIGDFMHSSPYGVHLDVNIDGYSIPLYWADDATPVATVFTQWGGTGWSGANGSNATGTMPIPVGARPDAQSDHHLLIVDRARGLEWGCWNMNLAGGQWSARLCAVSDLMSTGVRPPTNQGQPWYLSIAARACGLPLIAGLIRAEEIAAGRIDHALVVAYPHIRSRWFTPPASTAQGTVGTSAVSTRGIPCGGRIQFDPGVDLDTLGLSRSGRIILRALQEYGAFVGDYSGAISLYAESSPSARAYWSTGVLDSYELPAALDLSRFRVIQPGPLYDGGTGD